MPNREFTEGQRVVLKANFEEGWEREEGVIDGPSSRDTWIVTVDPRFRKGADDGLREVTSDQVE